MHYMLNICKYVLELYVLCIWQWYILYHTFKINSYKITQRAFLIFNHMIYPLDQQKAKTKTKNHIFLLITFQLCYTP